MHYKARHLDVSGGKLKTNAHPLYRCYAESDDGIHWQKPKLGIHEFRGSKDNNIIMVSGRIGKVDADPGHPAGFKDENPHCPPHARYKAIIRSRGPPGRLALKSPNGLHRSPLANHPVITEAVFESQNLAFWDTARKQYRTRWRIFRAGVTTEKVWKPATVRARSAQRPQKIFSTGGLHADPVYKNSPTEHLYTNQIKAQYRPLHFFIGFPARYVERGWSDPMRALPELQHRKLLAKVRLRYGTALTAGLLMGSRNGALFQRWNEAFLGPGIERPGTWHYGQQYIAWRVLETRSALPGAPNQLSLYAGESYWTGNSSALRRYRLRIDGFVSVQAPLAGRELITRPIIFKGTRLTLNFATGAAGDIRVQMQQPDGRPIPGFTLADCNVVFGDALERTVTWTSGSDLSRLAGQPVRLRFVMRDADLYSFRLRA